MNEIGREYTPLEIMTRISDVEEPNAPTSLFVAGDVDLLPLGRRVSVPTRNPD